MRRLHRAFGHVPKSVMINLVRAAKVRKEFVDAVKLHRCETCEKTSPKKPTHKVTLPSDYTFNHTLGIDLLELCDWTEISNPQYGLCWHLFFSKQRL